MFPSVVGKAGKADAMSKPDTVRIVKGVLAACDELMTEFISRKRAANWQVINDGLVAAERFVRDGDRKRGVFHAGSRVRGVR